MFESFLPFYFFPTTTLFLDDDKKCLDNVSVYGKSPNDAIMRADTFMFVSHLPDSPVEADVDYS